MAVTCSLCKNKFPWSSFKDERGRYRVTCDKCRITPDSTFVCESCHQTLPLDKFTFDKDNRRSRVCAECSVTAVEEPVLKKPKISEKSEDSKVGIESSTSRPSPSGLSSKQQTALSTILNSIVDHTNKAKKLFLIEGRAGTGKTYLLHRLCSTLAVQERNVVCTAGTDIAASLLDNATGAKKQFTIPTGLDKYVYYDEDCTVPKETVWGYENGNPELKHLRELESAEVILWDDATANSRKEVEYVDRMLRNLRHSDQPFAGISVVFAGDFAQWAPEPKSGMSPSSNRMLAISTSELWDQVIVLKLDENMRLSRSPSEDDKAFAQYLNTIAKADGEIRPPESAEMYERAEDMYLFVFPDELVKDQTQWAEIASRAVIVSRLDSVSRVNDSVSARFPGTEKVYRCRDVRKRGNVNRWDYDVDAELVSIPNQPDFPCYELRLKVGMPVVLLTGLNVSDGLCRGTRLIVESMESDHITARIVRGRFQGKVHTIGIESATNRGSGLTRHQLPVRPCFAVSVAESQGQSFSVVGVDTSGMNYHHGMLYVALSRASSVRHLAVCLHSGRTLRTYLDPEFKHLV